MICQSVSQLDLFRTVPSFSLLYQQISQVMSPKALAWLDDALLRVASEQGSKCLFTSFSQAARKLGKADLQVNVLDQRIADSICSGWDLSCWSVDQAARTLLLLALPADRPADRTADSSDAVARLLSSADVYERVAIYQSLPLLPAPERYLMLAVEGVRSSMTAVFEAIALRNPYPAQYFDEAAWNQMVLKALFEGSPLPLIEGLNRRANPKLARMLTDYAHERQAAHRSIDDPELWRLVSRFTQPMTQPMNNHVSERN